MSGGFVASANLASVSESATLGMTARAAALAAAGVPVVSLSAGEPDFPTPAYVVEAAIEAIRAGATHYPPAAGLPELRAAIAAYLNEECGGSYGPGNVIVTVGAKQAVFAAVFVLFGPGDRVVVPAPYWVSYPPIVRLARAEPVIVETTPEEGFKLTPERLAEALEEGAKGVVLNSPSNPTGATYSGAELDALVETAAEHGAWVIADEIYNEIRYGPGFASLAARAPGHERSVVVNGFSKTYSMTGWRVGYAAGPESLVQAMVRLQGHVNTNTATPSQHAALAALADDAARRSAVGEMVDAFARRRAMLAEGIAAIPGLEAAAPDGAFYFWVDARAWCARAGTGSAELCLDLLETEHVAIVPGDAFGHEGFVRLSFAASEAAIETALERLVAAARRLGVDA